MNLRRTLADLAVHALLLLTAAVSVIPLVWVTCAAFKTGPDLLNHTFLPTDFAGLRRLTTANFENLFAGRPMLNWLMNSLFLASTQTLISIFLCSMGGFALARYEFAGKRIFGAVALVTLMLPGQVVMPSLYGQVDRLGLVNTYAAILLPGAAGALGLILFERAMRAIPEELLSAARVDGCSEFRLWWSIGLPWVRPMTAAYSLISFIAAWNALLWPQLVLKDESMFPLTMGLSSLSALPSYQANFGPIMAGTLVSIAPLGLLFLLVQKEFMSGLGAGAVKA